MALVRVKRRQDEDSIDVLLLACKKQKTDFPISAVFKFAGTVGEKDQDVNDHIKNAQELLSSEKFPLFQKRKVSDITKKLKEENKLFSKNNRLKVIDCFRFGENGQEKELTVVDIEAQPKQITNEAPKDSCSLVTGSPHPKEQASTEEQYVYDLYYSNGDFDDLLMENVLSAHAIDKDNLFGDFLEDEEKEEDVTEDEDDSNDENNWRNDYPDEESDDSSVSECNFGLVNQMRNINLDGEYESDLSSDREDEALIFGDDDHYRGHYYCPSSSSDESENCE